MSRIVQTRQLRPWLQFEWIFQLTSLGAEERKSLKILHDFTDKVIQERKLEHKAQRPNDSENHQKFNDEDDIGTSEFQYFSNIQEFKKTNIDLINLDGRKESLGISGPFNRSIERWPAFKRQRYSGRSRHVYVRSKYFIKFKFFHAFTLLKIIIGT